MFARLIGRSLPGALAALAALYLFAFAPVASGQEKPYFVTYSTDLEEPGNLEVEFKGLTAHPKFANAFFSGTLELEYGATAWWTTELYGQATSTENDSTNFTGFRWENRFRPLPREYWINPVIYVEYERVSDADKSLLEITGHDSIARFQVNNDQSHKIVEKSIESKLILSSNFKGINLSENIIAEKNLSNEPWEFGYALAGSRPLTLQGSARRCTLCRQNVGLGAELYGGLGDRYSFGLKQTSQYAGPAVTLNTPSGFTYAFSPQFGLNDNSIGLIWRFKVSYEFQQVRDIFRRKQ
jgi:hypothetical protein